MDVNELPKMKEREAVQKTLEALIEKPTTYRIDVLDNTMLPEKLKKRDVLEFVVKPPTMDVMARIGLVINELPEDIMAGQADYKKLMEYTPQICQILSILMHGKSKSRMPDWYPEFLHRNLTPKEAVMMFQESVMKLRTDFFLFFFRHAADVIPTMMKQRVNSN